MIVNTFLIVDVERAEPFHIEKLVELSLKWKIDFPNQDVVISVMLL